MITKKHLLGLTLIVSAHGGQATAGRVGVELRTYGGDPSPPMARAVGYLATVSTFDDLRCTVVRFTDRGEGPICRLELTNELGLTSVVTGHVRTFYDALGLVQVAETVKFGPAKRGAPLRGRR